MCPVLISISLVLFLILNEKCLVLIWARFVCTFSLSYHIAYLLVPYMIPKHTIPRTNVQMGRVWGDRNWTNSGGGLLCHGQRFCCGLACASLTLPRFEWLLSPPPLIPRDKVGSTYIYSGIRLQRTAACVARVATVTASRDSSLSLPREMKDAAACAGLRVHLKQHIYLKITWNCGELKLQSLSLFRLGSEPKRTCLGAVWCLITSTN